MSNTNLSSAKWIWLPSQRTLANTFVLFRHKLNLPLPPISCDGRIFVDSRYRLFVNGQRIQFGPAPCDPRFQEADPLDLTPFLTVGENVICVESLFYGHGDGTWATGKPGFLFTLQVKCADGSSHSLVSDQTWSCCVDRSHQPGGYKRWYLRALQEQCDNRKTKSGWLDADYHEDAEWMAAAELAGRPDRPSICTSYPDYATDAGSANVEQTRMDARDIPMMHEEIEDAVRFSDAVEILWHRPAEDWFDFRIPGSWATGQTIHTTNDLLPVSSEGNAVLTTYDFGSDKVAWPIIEIDAPKDTTIELLWSEAHDCTQKGLSDGQFFAWTRLICREGINRFEAFDFECFRWLQVHVRNAASPVRIIRVARRTRRFPWPTAFELSVADQPLQRLFQSAANTLDNSAQETCVDGMARERQQYSGDCGHQLQSIRFAFGETRLPKRFMRTWSQGLTQEGYFLDCWPGYDRMNRVAQRLMGLTHWGPILDHGVGFAFDCWQHYMDTGDRQSLAEPFPRLLIFAKYLLGLRGKDGLVPVENIGTPSVWIDHHAYRQQRHKECAFNLYIAAALTEALVPMAQMMNEPDTAKQLLNEAHAILAATQRKFWHEEAGLFINNLPWHQQEGSLLTCDRSLATAVLYGQCPTGSGLDNIRHELLTCPERMGFSYPANAIWRLRALVKLSCAPDVVNELRSRWATMPSVQINQTLSEDWSPRPDGTDQWSHCPIAPLNIFYADLLGLRPVLPGFEKYEICPAGLEQLGTFTATARTIRGNFSFEGQADDQGYSLSITPPLSCSGVLVMNGRNQPLHSGQENKNALRAASYARR